MCVWGGVGGRGDAGPTQGDIVLKSDNDNFADLISTKTNMAIVRVYTTPPLQMIVDTFRVSVPTKRVAFFTTSNAFAVYEVDL